MKDPGIESVRLHLRTVRVLALSMMAGVVIFGGFVLLLLASPDYEPPRSDLPPALRNGLIALSILLLVLAPVVTAKLAAKAGSDPEEAFRNHQQRVIFGFGLREAAGVLGLVVALLTGMATWGFAIAGAALFTMGMAWPRQNDLIPAGTRRPPSPGA